MNKRSHIRILVALRVAAESPTGSVRALTKNLSVGGLFLLTDAKWPSGTEVSMVLEHKSVAIEMRATVTHAREDGLGMRFIDPPPAVVTELIGVIDDILSRGADLDGGEEMLDVEEHLVVFRRGMLEYVGAVVGGTDHEMSIESSEVLRDGEPLLVLLPARSDGVHVREIVGSFATVSAVSENGFTVSFVDASDEFLRAARKGRL